MIGNSNTTQGRQTQGQPTARQPARSRADIRESFRVKLTIVVEHFGSAVAVARIMGVNRTQFSRYVSGASMPRPELVYQLCEAINVPMEWMFAPVEHSQLDLEYHQLGESMKALMGGRRFQLDNSQIADGYYLFWKGILGVPDGFESLLATIKGKNGVKRIKTSMIRALRKKGVLAQTDQNDKCCNGVMFRSSVGVTVLFSDKATSNFGSAFLQFSDMIRNFGSADNTLVGTMMLHRPPVRGGNCLVPMILERISDNTRDILQAARSSRRLSKQELPVNIRQYVDEIGTS